MNGNDKTQWRCYVGLIDYDDAMNIKLPAGDKRVYKHSSVLDASDDWNKLKSKHEWVGGQGCRFVKRNYSRKILLKIFN